MHHTCNHYVFIKRQYDLSKEHSSWWLGSSSPILACHLMQQMVTITAKSLWVHAWFFFYKYPSRFKSHHNWVGGSKKGKTYTLTIQKTSLDPCTWFTNNFNVILGGLFLSTILGTSGNDGTPTSPPPSLCPLHDRHSLLWTLSIMKKVAMTSIWVANYLAPITCFVG